MLWRLNQETIYLKKWFNLKAIDRSQSKERVSMLQVGFKLLNQSKDFDVRIKQYTPLGKTNKEGKQLLHKTGLENFDRLRKINIMVGKLLIVMLVLLLTAGKGHFFFWSKNWLTQKLLGQKGFSGIAAFLFPTVLQAMPLIKATDPILEVGKGC